MLKFRGKMSGFKWQLLILIIFSGAASAQSTKELKDIFSQAESYYLYEEYDLANQLYILLETPDNLNIKYKIGICYLNIPGEKAAAIPYLEEAVKNASYEAKSTSFNEKKAPLDAYFYLGKAFMINNELEKGLNTLNAFNNLSRGQDVKGGMQNLEFIDQQIQACKKAIEFMDRPVELTKKMLGSGFAQGSMNENPAVSFDGNSIAYTERRGMVNVILYSRKERDVWQTPVDITQMLNAGEDCSTCAFNSNGTELFLYKNDMYDGNIYSSQLVNGSWTSIKKLNKNINTKFYESHASVSADGNKLYFTSNRDGGAGSLDIYVSEKDPSGDWGPAVNLGNTINTPYNEDIPFITENDSLLYFCSEGHTSMGGYDNFKSLRLGTGWKTPSNLGSPINTTDDDKFFQPFNNGKNAFYSMTTDYKKKDIFFLGLGSTNVNQVYEIMGKYTLADTTVAFDNKYTIHLVNKTSGDTIDVGHPNKYTGRYSFVVAPGSFILTYTGRGYVSLSIDTTIVQDNPSASIELDVIMEKDSSFIPVVTPVVEVPVIYEKINLKDIPLVAAIDSSILIKNMNVNDVNDANVRDVDILYFTVQVMALYNPVDISFFKRITDMRVMYNDVDKFYRYTTGRCATREEAAALRLDLIRKGYPEEIFIKKVSK
jgi:hypothetical protein